MNVLVASMLKKWILSIIGNRLIEWFNGVKFELTFGWNISPLYIIINRLPGKRNKILASAMYYINWYKEEAEWFRETPSIESETEHKIDLYGMKCYIDVYNANKYFWMRRIID